MRIAFVDPHINYTIDTPYKEPIGGSQSSVCYLAELLAKRGHKVTLWNGIQRSTKSRGVICLPLKKVKSNIAREQDVIVVINQAAVGIRIREHIHNSKLIFWTQHDTNQKAVQVLKRKMHLNSFDSFVFVSNWQKNKYKKVFNIGESKTNVLRNAVGPSYNKLFKNKKILKHKKRKLLA